jgi:hypothetical protein
MKTKKVIAKFECTADRDTYGIDNSVAWCLSLAGSIPIMVLPLMKCLFASRD